VALWGRSPDKAAALCQALRTAHPDATFRTSTDLEQDARAADVIVTATAARAPLIQSDWIRPGQHITSVGSDDATKCELDPALLARAALFVDAAASGRAYGSPHRAIEAGLISPEAMTEIGALVMTPRPRAADALTVACLSGLGIQDLLAVRALWDRITT
jgi:ornithine cyclodeaminase